MVLFCANFFGIDLKVCGIEASPFSGCKVIELLFCSSICRFAFDVSQVPVFCCRFPQAIILRVFCLAYSFCAKLCAGPGYLPVVYCFFIVRIGRSAISFGTPSALTATEEGSALNSMVSDLEQLCEVIIEVQF